MHNDIPDKLGRIEASAYATIALMTTPDDMTRLIAAMMACDAIDAALDAVENA